MKNADRAVYTFSMHNLAEMCFKDTFPGNRFELNDENKTKIDICIQKYMQSLVLVRKVLQEELTEEEK